MRETHGGDDDPEWFARGRRLGGDLGDELEVGEAGTREDGEFLAADERGERVDDRDARDDGVTRHIPERGIERRAGDRAHLGSEHGGTAVERLAEPAPRAPHPALTDRDLEGFAREPDSHLTGVEPGSPLQHFHDREVLVDLEDERLPDLARGQSDGRHLIPPDVGNLVHHEKRPFDAVCPLVLDGDRELTGPGHPTAARISSISSRRRVTDDASSGGTSSRMRVAPARSISSTTEAGTPRPTSSRHRS